MLPDGCGDGNAGTFVHRLRDDTKLDYVQEVTFYKPDNALKIEVHINIFSTENEVFRNMNDLFEDSKEHTQIKQIEGVEIKIFDPTDNLLFLVLHTFKHFLFSGFGIRMVCDILLFQEKYQDEIHFDDLFKKLEKVNIPSQVTVINSSAFTYCESLESIAILEGVERINASAFRYCKSLKSITIPGSVKTIGDNAFEYCTSLKEAKLCDGIEQLLVGTFKNCSSLRSIYIPTSVKELGTSSFGGCANLRGIGIANDSVAYNAEFSIFQNCPKLTLYANENSKTQNYAEKYDIPFKPLSEFEKEMNYGKAGDLDDDDIVTAADALLVLRHSVGLEYFTAREIALANVDGDDSITSLDSLAILRYSVGYADSGMKFD